MKFTLHINQKQALDLGITSVNQAIIFDLLSISSVWAKTIIINDAVYYWVARQALAKELPLLNLKPDTIYRHLKSLAELGIIHHVKHGVKDCIRITEKGKSYYVGNKSDLGTNSEINPTKLGNKSENNSEINPTYQTTNKHQSINDQGLSCSTVLNEWIEYRKSIGKKLKPESIEKLITKFSQYTEKEQREAVNHSIENGYQGVFFNKLKGGQNGKSIRQQTTDRNLNLLNGNIGQPIISDVIHEDGINLRIGMEQ